MQNPDLPERIHRYRILSEIGRGSMGRVYLAEDPNIERRLALKVLSPRRLVDSDHGEELRERFLVEARAAGRLHHPGIVTVYDADTDPTSGAPYLAMEYVDGLSLHELLQGGAHLEVLEALSLLAQVARALHYAHQQEVIHRDIKPANLLVQHDGAGQSVAKVVDFGIAKLVSAALTQPGYVVGTPNYMAPEQVRGQAVDGRADLFALGAVLYESLTGRTAFGSDDIGNVHYKILSVDPRPPEMHNPAVTPAVRAVVDRALAKDADERFQTGEEMAEALETVAAEFAAAAAQRDEVDSSGTRRLPQVPAAPTSASQALVTDHTSLRDPRLPVAVGGESAPRWWYAAASGTFALLAMLALLALAPEFAKLEQQQGDPDQADGEFGPPWRTVPTPRFSIGDGSSTPELPFPLHPPPVPVDPKDPEGSSEVSSPDDFSPDDFSPDDFSPDDSSPDDPSPSEPLPASPPLLVPSPQKLQPPPPPRRPVETTAVEIKLRSYQREAYLSAWVDGRKLLTRRMTAGPFRRLWGKEFRFPLNVPTGRHSLELHFSGLAPRRVEAQKKIRRDFVAGQPQLLRVRLDGDELHLQFEASRP